MGGRNRYVSISLLSGVCEAVDELMDELEYWPSRAEFLREAALEKIRLERRNLNEDAWRNRSKGNKPMSEEEKKPEEKPEEEEEAEEEEKPEEE